MANSVGGAHNRCVYGCAYRCAFGCVTPRVLRPLGRGWLVLWLLFGLGQAVHADPFDHQLWQQLLQRTVVLIDEGRATQVDYDALARSRVQLKDYLNQLSAVTPATFDSWGTSAQLAFLINAYNAWTVELILTRYPDLESIKDLGSLFRSPWKQRFIPLLGETRSLDDLEHGLIRGSGRYQEPRIHFAVNCASIGCPALRHEAYVGDTLDAQLEDATVRFLKDRSRNRLHEGALEVSSIFKWYKEDFTTGWRGHRSLVAFLAAYGEALGLSEPQRQALLDKRLDIEYLDYDWALNKIR